MNQIANLHVAPDRRHLLCEDGTPFFYLADTAWELFHKLHREDASLYLKDRASKGFNVIQAAALAEQDGLRRSNAYGRCPLLIGEDGRFDPTRPDIAGEYSYWDHVDAIVHQAHELGLYIAMLPAWGDKIDKQRGEGPEIFTPESAYAYGEWLGRRYRQAGNIIWVLGGDRAFTTREQFNIMDHLARGLQSGDGGRYLMTFHPAEGLHSADFVHGEDWLDFNMIHSGQTCSRFNYDLIEKDLHRLPHKPVLDGEPCHEGCPENFNIENGFMDAADARTSAYWAVLSGACGHAYGHHSIAHFTTLPDKDRPRGYYAAGWKEALNHPGSAQMGHLRTLIESVDFIQGQPDSGMVANNLKGVNHVPVLRGNDWLLAYSAQGLGFELRLDKTWQGADACWFDPRTGEMGAHWTVKKEGVCTFTPPSAGRGADWALRIIM